MTLSLSRLWRRSLALEPGFSRIVGGTVVDVANYLGTGRTWRVHTFANGQTAQVLRAATPVRMLMLGSGGGGGNGYPNGFGGAGGMLELCPTFSPGAYAVTVGAAGTAAGVDGGNTTLVGPGVSLTAYGGGGGGIRNVSAGRTGGSGGGGAGVKVNNGTQNPGAATATTPLQGFSGGYGAVDTGTMEARGGGGGGAGSPGGGGSSADGPPGIGGLGRYSDITGTGLYYARGGGRDFTAPVAGRGDGGYNGAGSLGSIIIAYPIS